MKRWFRPAETQMERTPTAVADEAGSPAAPAFNRRLAVLLSMAMFVLVVDTSLMNVSISAVVRISTPV